MSPRFRSTQFLILLSSANLTTAIASADSLVSQAAFERIQAGAATVTLFNVPGAQATYPVAINEQGAIAGKWRDTNGADHGFVRSVAGVITTFDAPGAGSASLQGTQTAAINTAGAIAGSFIDANNALHGFIRSSNGKFVIVDYPGASSAAFMGTAITAINDSNVTTGLYNPESGAQFGFVREAAGTFSSFNYQGSLTRTPRPLMMTASLQVTTPWRTVCFAASPDLRLAFSPLTCFPLRSERQVRSRSIRPA